MKAILIALIALGLAVVAAGCGASSKSASGTNGTPSSGASGNVSTAPPPTPTSCSTKGGTLTVLSAGDVDHIDPGQAYYSFTYEVTRPTERALLGVQPGTTNLIPDLAASMPTVSADGKTVTVKIKQGIRFSPPVNREVTSADVKYAIERGFSASVANGYAAAYFSAIQGAPKTPPALSQPLTAPVPESYAKPFDDQAVSSYGLHQVATGPYMIKNTASGSINGVGYQPNKLIELVRNPNWDASTDFRLACVDQVQFKEGYEDPTVMTKTILSGSADANGDTPPPPAELKSILSNSTQKQQLFFTPTGGSRYIALNTSKPPFN